MPRGKIGFACLVGVCGLALLAPHQIAAQTAEDKTIAESISVLNEIMAIPNEGIPQGMLRGAYAVAIIPNVIKGSFVIGARYGQGVLMIRDNNGGWHAPVFISLGGGNVGWQIGVQSTDVLLVFKTAQSVQGLLDGKFTIGADAAVAAGPVGRQAAAATDGKLSAEIYSWSRSRGLFAGVSLDGSVISVEAARNSNYYRPAIAGGPVVVPEMAQSLARLLLQYSGMTPTGANPNQSVAQATTGVPQSSNPAANLATQRSELARSAEKMYPLLDDNWQRYLALPPEVFGGTVNPSLESLQQSATRFNQIRSDARYAALANNPQFQTTSQLLQQYIQALAASQSQLQLPAPPSGGN